MVAGSHMWMVPDHVNTLIEMGLRAGFSYYLQMHSKSIGATDAIVRSPVGITGRTTYRESSFPAGIAACVRVCDQLMHNSIYPWQYPPAIPSACSILERHSRRNAHENRSPCGYRSDEVQQIPRGRFAVALRGVDSRTDCLRPPLCDAQTETQSAALLMTPVLLSHLRRARILPATNRPPISRTCRSRK